MEGRQLYHRQLNRERVLDFEKEMKSKVDGLDQIHNDITKITELRRDWLNKIAKMDDIDCDTFLKKLETLKLQAELSSLNMKIDILRLEGHSEAQTLNYLVACTKPLENDETVESRNAELTKQAREDSEEMKSHLEHSLDYRIQLSNFNYDLNKELEKYRREMVLEQAAREEEFDDKVMKYMSSMDGSIGTSKKRYQDITSEYLILRHNARMAKEVLVRSQNDANVARQQLQSCLDQVIAEATEQRSKVEKASAAELKLRTDDLRNEVMHKEAEVERLSTHVKALEQRKKHENVSQIRKIRFYEKKYVELEEKRRKDLKVINDELGKLRKMISSVELSLSTVGLDPELTTEAVQATFNKNGALLLKLKSRIKELKTNR